MALLDSDSIVAEEKAHLKEEKHNRLQAVLRSRWTWIAKDCILAFFGLWGLGSMIYQQHQHPWKERPEKYVPSYDAEYAVTYNEQPCYCGTSVNEAISLGCVYDELSAGWLPERCRDDELTAEFGRLGDAPNGTWMYWADKNHTQPLSAYEVSLYADIQPTNFHMSYEWHRQHCFFLWRKEHRFKARGKYYDPRSDTEHHILHCIEILSNPTYGTAAGAALVG